jgi:hypothetical protein
MPTQRPAPSRGGPPSGRSHQGRGRARGRGGNSGNRPQRPTVSKFAERPTVSKFAGNCIELQGHIFDCSDYKQADTFVSTLKRIADHVGAEHRNGGDVRSSIISETKFVVPMPTETPIVDPLKPTAKEQVARMTFKGQLEAFVKRTATLEDNIQKTYSLVIGQCTNRLQSKLKQQAQWNAISLEQDAIALVSLIKTITFKFEDQKFLPLALFQSKVNVCNLRQNNMSNHEHLQRFQNLVTLQPPMMDSCTINPSSTSAPRSFIRVRPTDLSRELRSWQCKPLPPSYASPLCLFIRATDVDSASSLKNLKAPSQKGTTIIQTILCLHVISLMSVNTALQEVQHPTLLAWHLPRGPKKVMIITTRTRMTHGRKKPLAITVAKSDMFVLTVPHLRMQTTRNPTSTNRMLPPKTKRLKRKRKKPLSLNKPLKRTMKASLKVSSPTLGSVLLRAIVSIFVK